MEPTLNDGDSIIFEKFIDQKLNVGNIILCNHPYKKDKKIVKRIKKIIEENLVFLEGDNSLCSTDSRSFGPLSIDNIIGLNKDKHHE